MERPRGEQGKEKVGAAEVYEIRKLGGI